jgi:hypothetical protein
MRAVLPAALRSAVAGDSALLIRAVARQRVAGVPGVDNEEDLSPALFVTTVCEEEPVPWDRAAVLADRVSQSQAALAALPDTAFAPFGRAVGGGSPVLELCRNWPPLATPPPPVSPPPPAAPPPPVSPPPFPDVPVLAMGGKEDLRTPSTDALRVASLFPRGTFLEVPAVAHSVLASDPSGCADQAVRDFLAGRPVVRCTGRRRVVPPTPLPPSSVRALRPVPGVRGLPGKTLTAFARTLDDVTLSAVLALLDAPGTAGTIQAGGLRAGRFTLSRATGALELRGLSYVPGVVVSGRGKPGDSTWVISGSRAARGTLTLANGRVTGTLAGVAIDRPLAALRR